MPILLSFMSNATLNKYEVVEEVVNKLIILSLFFFDFEFGKRAFLSHAFYETTISEYQSTENGEFFLLTE